MPEILLPKKEGNATKRRCRVAVIWIDWYPYHVARFRGLLAAPALADAVVGIELVGGVGVHKGLKFREELPADLPVETLLPKASWREASQWTLARRLWARLSALDPEVVLVPGYYTLPGIAAALWARVHGRQSVLMTESTAGDHPRVWWRELPKRLTLRALFDWAVCGGSAHEAYLRQLRFPAGRVVGGYDVVDNAFFSEGTLALRARETPSQTATPSQPYFLYVGRLAEEKNVTGLLRAWALYREGGGRWPLVLCGDGPEREALAAQAAELPMAAEVHFPGLKTARELLPWYAAAGCFVLPSTREPWGLVVNEAMAAGLPVLVSDRCGCSPDLVMPGENGDRFDPTDLPTLASKLRAMEDLGAEERSRWGQRSAARIEWFSPAAFGASIGEILSSTGQHPQPRHLAEVTR